jgi:hypothetical protein
VLEKHDEVDESIEDRLESERRMQQAMEHAAAEAAAANAACGAGAGGTRTSQSGMGANSAPINRSTNLTARNSFATHSIISHDSFSSTTTSFLGDMDSQQESLDESFSSWSKSFDASFSAQSASICSGLSKRASRRKHRQERRFTIFKRCAMAGGLLMIVMYQMDPQKGQFTHQYDIQVQTPMGATGIFQWAFFLLFFYKVQRLIRLNRAAESFQRQQQQLLRQHQAAKTGNPTTTGSATMTTTTPTPIIYMTEQRSCPFLKASGRALERFKTKYARKLQRLTHRQQQHQQQQQQHTGVAPAAYNVQDPYYDTPVHPTAASSPYRSSHGGRYNP